MRACKSNTTHHTQIKLEPLELLAAALWLNRLLSRLVTVKGMASMTCGGSHKADKAALQTLMRVLQSTELARPARKALCQKERALCSVD